MSSCPGTFHHVTIRHNGEWPSLEALCPCGTRFTSGAIGPVSYLPNATPADAVEALQRAWERRWGRHGRRWQYAPRGPR